MIITMARRVMNFETKEWEIGFIGKTDIQPSTNHRLNTIFKNVFAGLFYISWISIKIILFLRKYIACVGEGGLPFSVLHNSVPADMIDMQMTIKNIINFFRINTGCPEVLNKWGVQFIKQQIIRPGFSIPGSCINQHVDTVYL
ncbi:hypothetical protein NG99_25430 [Erwinia typographi]|uniref:Uncharacterized protein n=1 Tax=Erwinia typographi TaxID=371042 RepID=A0A0A3YIP3_9GAMM|nr:hypothetical protein NG99_25430 [Erwinia typographi]